MLASTWAGIKNEIIWHEKSILYSRNIIVFLTLARFWFWPTTKSGVRESKVCKCVISCRVRMSCSSNSAFVDWLSRNHLTCQGGSIPVWPCKANIESWREFPQFCEWEKNITKLKDTLSQDNERQILCKSDTPFPFQVSESFVLRVR